MTMTLPVGAILTIGGSVLSEHNRQPVSISPNRIESSQRMANGTLRKFFIADKETISVSWNMLPSYSSFTIDGGMGARDIKEFYESSFGKTAFPVTIKYGTTVTPKTMMFASPPSLEIVKRNVRSDTNSKSAVITSAVISGSSIVFSASNSFIAGELVNTSGFESSQFNVSNAPVLSSTSSTFTVAKQKDLTASITEVSAANGIITYIANNTFSSGDRITITGLSTAAFNLTDVKVATAQDYYFTVINSATGAAITENAGGTASVVSETTSFSITKVEPSASNHNIKYTSVAHKLHVGESVNITGIRQDATITNIEAHSVEGQVKYTAANNFAVGDYINISGVTPAEYNINNAVILAATSTYFVIAIAATSKFRKSGIAKSVLNLQNVKIKSVTADTFTIDSPTAAGLAIDPASGTAQQIVLYPASAYTSQSAPQEFWNVSISLEEV